MFFNVFQWLSRVFDVFSQFSFVVSRFSKNLAGLSPEMRIQRFWRGLRSALGVMRQDDAAWKILRNYKAGGKRASDGPRGPPKAGFPFDFGHDPSIFCRFFLGSRGVW